jgi:outer membrane lipoprotein-sorting protein
MLKIKTMRKLVFLVILLTQLGQAQSSDQAKRLLDKTATQMAAYDNMQFDFTYVLENQKEQIRQETNGKVTVEKEKFLLEIPEATQLFDGQKNTPLSPKTKKLQLLKGRQKTIWVLTQLHSSIFIKRAMISKWISCKR